MAIALFKDTTYNLSGLIENIRRGEIALPEIQRPFVWQPAKVDAASGRPVFARSPESRDAKEHSEFWVRVNNSTRQLVGSDMVQYQEEHWG